MSDFEQAQKEQLRDFYELCDRIEGRATKRIEARRERIAEILNNRNKNQEHSDEIVV